MSLSAAFVPPEHQRRLALGTVQFGLDYGINNARGRVAIEEVSRILEYAREHGIDVIDTAGAYGDAETVLGAASGAITSFKVVSKIPPGATTPKAVDDAVRSSLARLGVGKLYGMLVHDLAGFMADARNWDVLRRWRDAGTVEKIGVSAYYPREIESLMARGLDLQLVQAPYSVFDKRFATTFAGLQRSGVEVHVRSIFLQGLFFMDPERLPAHFASVKPAVLQLQGLAKSIDVPLSALLLSVGLLDPAIDKVVVGVDSLSNLRENLAAFDHLQACGTYADELRHLSVDDESILLPFKWPKGAS